jgi:hypothetical protein
VTASENLGGGPGGGPEVQPGEQRLGLSGGEAGGDVDDKAPHGRGLGCCDLLNVHAAAGRKHDQGRAAGGIVQHRGIELAGDLNPALDQHPLDPVTTEPHAEHRLGRPRGLGRRIGWLDAARLAALAARHLCLDDNRAQPRGDLGRGAGVLRESALGDGDAGRLQQWLGGVLLEVHDVTCRTWPSRGRTAPPRRVCPRGWW